MRARPRRLLLGALLATLALGPRPDALAASHERILDFESRILVHGSGAVTIAETIRVVAAGRQIKRGIYRDFPTTYRDRAGNTVRVGFEVVSVERDGSPEPYFVEALSNGKRVYVGRKKIFLKPGTYSYRLTYRTDRQIGFFDDYDELYWNVTGSSWSFPIERARAVVELPPGAEVLQRAAYTGPQGATGSDVTMGRAGGGSISFATTRTLDPGEGLTVAVAWPKGFVHEPSLSQQAGFLLRGNASLLAALVGLGLLTIYYLLTWLRVGRDPPSGTIIPLFAPPRGFTPAAVRFVMRMGYDHKVFAAAVVIMAVKGYLTISEDGDGDFTLKKTGEPEAKLSAGEKKLAKELFRSDREVELKTANHARVGGALKALKTSLRGDFEKLHFARNRRYLVPGVILSLLALGAIVASAGDEETALFMTVWLGGWTAGCYFLITRVLMSWRGGSRAAAVGATLFAAPFIAGEVAGLGLFAQATSPAAGAVFLVILLVNVLFYHLLKAPTVAGRRVMDQIEGFKLYLTVAEGERLAAFDPPEKTPELFEKYLPYALALDVENEWSEQFAETLAAAGRDTGGYRPGWYRGGSWSGRGPSGLASQLGGSLSGAISSSSTAPGSSSGSGGGGSSGGGGGGGGGGGW
jgi:hypothetical protein